MLLFSQTEDVQTMLVTYVCQSTAQDIITGIIFGYKILIQIAALYLAFKVRKVNVKGLNDSRYNALIVYITTIALAVVFICRYTLDDYTNAYAVVVSVGVMVEATSVLSLTFIPNMSYI